MRLHHLKGHTYHKRIGRIGNSFKYRVDYVLTEPESPETSPALFSYNRPNGFALHEKDNGGVRGAGTGTQWVRNILEQEGVTELGNFRILLLTQPRVFGHVFNPVSFWLFVDENHGLRGAIAEVNNTFGDRHSYLCAHDDLRLIEANETVKVQKLFYVSPFQPVEGEYTFRFTFTQTHIGIRIDLRHGQGGIVATLGGELVPLTSIGIAKALISRPFGSLRVLVLIYYQAMKLRLKGARYLPYSKSTDLEVSK